MMTPLSSGRRVLPARAALVLGLLWAAACVEPRQASRASDVLSSRDIGLQVVVSDTLAAPGSPVLATVRLVTSNGTPTVRSYTARLTYDSLALAFVAMQPMDDGATRAFNSTAGLVRTAGIATKGFAAGRLFAAMFQVRRAGGARTIAARLDEAHADAHDDLLPRVRPVPMTQEQAR